MGQKYTTMRTEMQSKCFLGLILSKSLRRQLWLDSIIASFLLHAYCNITFSTLQKQKQPKEAEDESSVVKWMKYNSCEIQNIIKGFSHLTKYENISYDITCYPLHGQFSVPLSTNWSYSPSLEQSFQDVLSFNDDSLFGPGLSGPVFEDNSSQLENRQTFCRTDISGPQRDTETDSISLEVASSCKYDSDYETSSWDSLVGCSYWGDESVCTQLYGCDDFENKEKQYTEKCGNNFYKTNVFSRIKPKRPDMESLLVRMSTYNNFPAREVDTKQLAKNGFFFIGAYDATECYVCGIKVYDWKKFDFPMDVHRRENPVCPIVKGLNVKQVHTLETDAINKEVHLGKASRISTQKDSFSKYGNLPAGRREKTKNENTLSQYQISKDDGGNLCYICQRQPPAVQFTVCGHKVVCSTCSDMVIRCPQCSVFLRN